MRQISKHVNEDLTAFADELDFQEDVFEVVTVYEANHPQLSGRYRIAFVLGDDEFQLSVTPPTRTLNPTPAYETAFTEAMDALVKLEAT